MSEELTHKLVLELLETCYAAFPTHAGMKTNPRGTVVVYRDGLQGLDGEAVRAAVRVAIGTGKFFPKIAELREFANEWTRRNTVHIDPAGEGEGYACLSCGTRPRWVDRWRPRFGADGAVVLTADGRAVVLERYERLLCRCAALCAYAPEGSIGEPVMFVHRITWSMPWPAARPQVPTAAPAAHIADVAGPLIDTALVHGRLVVPDRVAV